MCYILVQPDNSPESLMLLKYLVETGYYGFELSLDRPWLYPVLFRSHSKVSFEETVTLLFAKLLVIDEEFLTIAIIFRKR